LSDTRFIFKPSPPVNINDTAVYQCQVGGNGIDISWFVNMTALSNINNDDFILSGTGLDLNLTVLALPDYNNTVIRCFGAGFINGNFYTNSSASVLKIQGILLYMILVHIYM
jgi:hypothetical protein